MKVTSRVFGEVTAAPEQVLRFPEGLYGFPDVKDFVVLDLPAAGAVLKWLQAVSDPDLGFVLVDPRAAHPDYNPPVDSADLKALGLDRLEDSILMLVAVVPANVQEMTVNLQAPLLINPQRRLARQLILAGAGYPLRWPVFKQEGARPPAGKTGG